MRPIICVFVGVDAHIDPIKLRIRRKFPYNNTSCRVDVGIGPYGPQ